MNPPATANKSVLSSLFDLCTASRAPRGPASWTGATSTAASPEARRTLAASLPSHSPPCGLRPVPIAGYHRTSVSAYLQAGRQGPLASSLHTRKGQGETRHNRMQKRPLELHSIAIRSMAKRDCYSGVIAVVTVIAVKDDGRRPRRFDASDP